MKLGSGEGPDRIGRFYSYYSAEELYDHLQAAGFEIARERRAEGEGLDGSPSRLICLLSRAISNPGQAE